MIYKSLELIRRSLEDYINLQLQAEADEIPEIDFEFQQVALQNIALFEELRANNNGGGDADNPDVIMSLVNIEEEASLKNNPQFKTTNIDGTVDYRNPPVFVNLYLLLSCIDSDYHNALRTLTLIMQFFQSRKIFTVPNAFDPLRTAGTANDLGLEFSNVENIHTRLNIELFSMSFEQVNHLWGSLGGKQSPFAMYVIRLVRVEDVAKQKGGGVIKEVLINE